MSMVLLQLGGLLLGLPMVLLYLLLLLLQLGGLVGGLPRAPECPIEETHAELRLSPLRTRRVRLSRAGWPRVRKPGAAWRSDPGRS